MRYWQLLILTLIGCVTSPPTVESTHSERRIELIFSGGRFLEFQPCDCKVINWGGMDREWAARRSFASAPEISLSAGSNFVPSSQALYSTESENLGRRAELMVRALNHFGTRAMGVNYADLSWVGLAKVKALEKSANFAFLSSNIVDSKTQQTVFTAGFEIKTTSVPLWVMAVSPGKTDQDEDFAGISVIPVEIAVRRALRKMPAGPHVVVVLSSLNDAERKPLFDIPEVNFILGSGRDVASVEQTAGTQVFVSSADRGRGITRIPLHFSAGDGFKTLFNPSVSASLMLEKEKLPRGDRRITRILRILDEAESGPSLDYSVEHIPLRSEAPLEISQELRAILDEVNRLP